MFTKCLIKFCTTLLCVRACERVRVYIYIFIYLYVVILYTLYRLNVDMDMNIQVLPVATHLPPGYLSIQPLGLGKGVKIK